MGMRSPLSPTLPERSDGLLDVDRPDPVATVELRLPARPSELGRMRAWVSQTVVALGCDGRPRFEFVVAVNEAVTNAIRHGSPAADGTIGVSLESDGGSIVCSVCDCGPFVPPSRQSDPTSDEGGRGFAFMAALTDELELVLSPDATVVRLRKWRPAEAHACDV
jgi:serine/threonine-protein kinase RsbW